MTRNERIEKAARDVVDSLGDDAAIEDLAEALALPDDKPEPVAWAFIPDGSNKILDVNTDKGSLLWEADADGIAVPLYANPPALSDTAPSPVAWGMKSLGVWVFTASEQEHEAMAAVGNNMIPLYTAPPAPAYVPMTDKEMSSIWAAAASGRDIGGIPLVDIPSGRRAIESAVLARLNIKPHPDLELFDKAGVRAIKEALATMLETYENLTPEVAALVVDHLYVARCMIGCESLDKEAGKELCEPDPMTETITWRPATEVPGKNMYPLMLTSLFGLVGVYRPEGYEGWILGDDGEEILKPGPWFDASELKGPQGVEG